MYIVSKGGVDFYTAHIFLITFKSVLLTELVASFNYQHKLYGVEADDFFGSIGTRYKIQAGRIVGHTMLIFTRSHALQIEEGELSGNWSPVQPEIFQSDVR